MADQRRSAHRIITNPMSWNTKIITQVLLGMGSAKKLQQRLDSAKASITDIHIRITSCALTVRQM